VDPYAVLGVRADATADELAARYHELAKRWHPDRAGAEAGARMAEINSAYDVLRSELWQAEKRRAYADAHPGSPAVDVWGDPVRVPQPARRRPAGEWLDAHTRRALGPELLGALLPGEAIEMITPTAVSASPQALLAVTDRRMLWLLDDAVSARVRSLDFGAITGIDERLSWPRRRWAEVRVSRRNGRRPLGFGELRPETAGRLAALLRAKVQA
jgi:hypothetical protein